MRAAVGIKSGFLNAIRSTRDSSTSTVSRINRMTSALTAIAYEILVSPPSRAAQADSAFGKVPRPAHHLNDSKTSFKNPWPSFRYHSGRQWARFMYEGFFHAPSVPKDIASLIPVHTPTWGAGLPSDAVKATWLGHACYLVELPTPAGSVRGPRVIFDPALSHRCSPIQFMGPARYTPVPCKPDDIPVVDAIVLSHNHYDHADSNTLCKLNQMYHPHIFAPLGNHPYLSSLGFPSEHIHILDWWEERLISISLPTQEPSPNTNETPKNQTQITFKVTCTPCQHGTNRTPFDRFQTLWSSWAVEEILEGIPSKKVYFAGDTAYRSVGEGEDEDSVPVCPAFAEIGEKIGPFDLALIPIGAYSPRWIMSSVHVAPSDSVRIFKDIKAKKALAMHWGTWVLTTEPIMEPPNLLKKECKKAEIPDGDFDICGLGETRAF